MMVYPIRIHKNPQKTMIGDGSSLSLLQAADRIAQHANGMPESAAKQ